ncbi:TetR family transcriptional regulator [Rhodopseudomonas palustris]|uniref:TetR family transcriptional regulator n=1 Tax=Rhodopseudomonas palustris TaxID=1076 RepID=A0A0D7F0Y0_RHOPL|nr:TetR family transcriptional regulator [Rhodopseudomonas palustris]
MEGAANWQLPVRADARRNINALLKAAMTVFATSGVDAPMREIAEQAGVGVGTIYRHFPVRADLIVAVCRNEVDTCAEAAATLAAQHPPRKALSCWIDRYIALVSAKRGLAAALHSGDPAYDGLPAYFENQLSPALDRLLKAAAAAGEIRSDVSARDLLWAVAGLCAPRRTDNFELARRMIDLLLDGLRAAPDAAIDAFATKI